MKTDRLFISIILFAAVSLAGCSSRLRVGELQTQSQSVELSGARSIRVEIDLGAGDLEVAGGAEELLEADFTYNVAQLKPEVTYRDGTLVVRQPDAGGIASLQNITDFRNQWNLRLYDEVPMDLSVDMGAGLSNLKLADLSLTRLDVILGAGTSTLDLSGDWARDLDVTIEAGAVDLTVLLPGAVGVRVEIDRGPTTIDAPGFAQDGNVYTNTAYGVSGVTLHVDIKPGIGSLQLEAEE